MLRNHLIALAAAASAALSLSAHAEPVTLRIQDYPGIGNFLVRIANANGLCEKHGLKCELKTIPQAPLGMQTLLSGDLDVAFTPPEVVVQAANKGADIRAIGSGAVAPIFFLMAGAGMETPSEAKGYPAVMQDFKGKKIGVTARGSAAEFQLVSLLKGAGMSADDVTIVAVGAPNTAFPAISQKQVDALMLFTPMDGFCEVSKACRMVVDPRKGQGPADVLSVTGAAMLQVVRGDFLAKNAKTIAGYDKAMREAADFVQKPANFDAALKVAQDTFKITAPGGDKILELALRNSMPSFHYQADAKAFQNAAQYMQSTGQISKVVDTSKLLAAQ
ncbi:ABC transporter substrate-binding protein [Variovorax dokdonensis]|uniref:ABC transporter substrate-binding protein n=1 Tax=Variovorax dokdonensis TaxID=344883 RepID=A0ABT7N5T9_9BURK|nr:ABC transporter substrate-binding protein [Variovorax dokdonensis]MDM0043324.1 ABC transporter substrate-binding protein [Variovorax dokdonensis]